MKSAYSFLLLLLLLRTTGSAQKQGNIWHFGDHAGIDFSSGTPVSISGGMTHNTLSGPHSEGSTVICDSSGALLCYSNGETVWNRNHQVMQNGSGLLGHLSSTQSSLLVPKPGSQRYFYLFTTDAFYQSNLQNGFRYSVIDMCMDGGLGAVTDQKNILLLDTVAEKLTAVRHANGSAYWIVVHKYYSDAFYAYPLTAGGLGAPVISGTGSMHMDYCWPSTLPTKAAIGQLKASPDGSKLVCVAGQGCNNISELFDFDRATGIVSNPVYLNTDQAANSLYGASFSPDNTKLYITSQVNSDRIYQFDVSSGNSTTINNSKLIVADNFPNGGPSFMSLQLGPDGKLYVARRGKPYLDVINSPNLSGTACGYVNAGVALSDSCSYGLPNLVDFFDYSNDIPDCAITTGLAQEDAASLVLPNPNPSEGAVSFTLDEPLHDATLQITDALGRVLLERSFGKKQTLQIDETLPAGIYFYRISASGRPYAGGKLIRR